MTVPTPHSVSLTVSPQEVGDWAKTIGAISGVVGGAWLALRRLWSGHQQRRSLERELREAQADLVCVLADHRRVELLQFFEHRYDPQHYRDLVAVLRARLGEARKRYWSAMGFPESVDDDSREEIKRLRPLRMTQRWKMRQDHPGDK